MEAGKTLGRPLDSDDIDWAAAELGVSDSHIRAVLAVEAAGSGFLDRQETGIRQPKVLFEAHVFGRETEGRFHETHPRLSSRRWKRTLYLYGLAEHGRLQQAAALDWTAAHRSASWGIFQIMGFNHELAGFSRLEDFVGVQYVSEGLQLRCGVSFIRSGGLHEHLQRQDWRAFARAYNGPAYARNHYHERLEKAFRQFDSRAVIGDEQTARIQEALNRAGANLVVDGVAGSRTEAAIVDFQRQQGLAVDGIAGPKTLAALGIREDW